jgi:type II secretory ATPase GspE/PulE/Tfp pilus assembly ATPase PilB-like protein
METKVLPDNLQELQQKVAYAEQVKRITNLIHAAKDLDQILLDLHKDLISLFDAEGMTLYAVDTDKKEIFSKVPQVGGIEEIRVPISELSLVGFTAKYLRPVNIADAYDRAELAKVSPTINFDSSWDKKTGFKTKQVLTYPIVAENKYLMGVLQLLNKKSGGRFTKKDEESVAEIAKALGIAFYNLKKLAKKTPTKFDYLVANNLITQAELDAAVAEARKGPADMETLLIEKYKVPKAEVGKSLSQFYKCPLIEYNERVLIDPELLKTLNLDYLKKNFWAPLKRDKNMVEILIDDPNDLDKIQDIKRIFPGQSIRFGVCLRRDITQFLRAASGEADSGGPQGSISEILGELASESEAEKKVEETSAAAVDENDSAIVRLANQIIADAYRMNASDIHVEPYGEKKETMVRFRVDGSCFEYMKIPPSYRRAIVSRLKIMSNLDIAERRKPQDGKIKFKLAENKEIELRVATIPTSGVGNEDVVMRILAASEPLPLEKMSFSERNLRELKRIADMPYGIILCVGPTGSGKTTTLHSVLGYINTPDMKIWTAEDPVEITQYGLRQVQVQPKIGFTFAIAMRAFLRADPDVIMVGEMRDKETAETGIEASLTGHQVFSTLHTNSAVETVTRLLDMEIDSFSFADAMLGVLAQRLCKRICKECKEPYHPPQEEYDALVLAYGKEWWDKSIKTPYDDNFTLYRGKGCDACGKTGFKGRIGLHELLLGTDRMKRLIQTKAKTEEMLKVAIEEGMTTLVQDGIEKVLQGHTTFKEVKAVAMK